MSRALHGVFSLFCKHLAVNKCALVNHTVTSAKGWMPEPNFKSSPEWMTWYKEYRDSRCCWPALVRKNPSQYIMEGSLEAKLPTIWTDEKQRWEESERREESKREDQRGERVRRKKMQMHEKAGKSRSTVFFPMICGSGGSKSGLAKAAGAEPAGQMRDEKLHAVLARSTFSSQNVQNTHQLRTTFGS